MRDERHLDVDLGEFGLAVGARVLIAETARDLHVAAEAADHQDLLEDLRRLRERVERAAVDARGDQIVARALGRRLDQRRRLDLEKVAIVEVIADRFDDAVAHRQVTLHPRAAQVEIAIAQPNVLVGLFVGRDDERRRLRAVEDDQLPDRDFHLAGRKARILRAGGAALHQPAHLDHELAAQLFSRRKGQRRRIVGVGVEDELGEAVAVTQVDEDQPAVIAPPMHPPVDFDEPADVGGGEGAARGAGERVIHAKLP